MTGYMFLSGDAGQEEAVKGCVDGNFYDERVCGS